MGPRSRFPLKSNGAVFGALILYASRPHAFDEQTRSHFTDLANDLAYGVMAIRTRMERARVEAELRRIEAYLEEKRLTHTGSWAWNVATRENIYWSAEHYRIFGLDPVRTRTPSRPPCRKFSGRSGQFDEILDTASGKKRISRSMGVGRRDRTFAIFIASDIPSSTRTARSSSSWARSST